MPLRLLRFAVALVAGLLLWQVVAVRYNRVVAWMAAPLLRIDSRFADADLDPRGDLIAVRSDRGVFPLALIPATQLTYNAILLLALFASNARPLRGRNIAGFLVSLLIVMALHPVSALISIESTYALRLGEWSRAHYGDFAANVWMLLELFWRLVGMFAVPFACWWLASTEGTSARLSSPSPSHEAGVAPRAVPRKRDRSTDGARSR